MPLIDWFNYGANEQEAKELQALFFGGGIITAIRKLILQKHLTNVEFDENTLQIKEFIGGDHGLVFRLRITTDANITNTVEFRLFFNCFLLRHQFSKIDKEAGLKDKDLDLADLIRLRILYVIFDQVKFYSIQDKAVNWCNRKTHVSTVWTQDNSGWIGRQGVIN